LQAPSQNRIYTTSHQYVLSKGIDSFVVSNDRTTWISNLIFISDGVFKVDTAWLSWIACRIENNQYRFMSTWVITCQDPVQTVHLLSLIGIISLIDRTLVSFITSSHTLLIGWNNHPTKIFVFMGAYFFILFIHFNSPNPK